MPELRRTGFLDDFQRPDESPLSWDGRWGILAYNYGTVLSLQGHAVEVHTVTGGTYQSSYWAAAAYSSDVEVWGIGEGSNDLREGLALYLHLKNTYTQTGNPLGYSGYRAYWNVGIGNPTPLTIARIDDGTPTDLVTTGGGFNDTGGINLFRRIGDSLEVWMTSDPTGATGWALQASASDATYDRGFIGLATAQDDPNPGWVGFGGGARNRSQYIRYVSN